ncbi:MAG: carotenoid oxygenase family protein [Actinomycetota bacterium]
MSAWTRGTKAPVADELDVSDLVVTEGVLPPLSGRLVRLGPNPIGPVDENHHWFSGTGMAHAVDLDAGRPTRFVNRWVRTPEVSRALGEAPSVPPADQIDLANTSAMMVAGELLAMTETCQPFVLDDDLATVRRADFGADVTEFTAHPHTDPDTGEVFAIGYAGNDDPACTVYRIGSDGVLLGQRRVDLLGPRSIHDVAVTERHVVVWDLPLEYADDDPALFPYAWNRDGAARVGLLDRSDLSAPVRWFDVDPCWVFHPLNAYDTDRGVVLDVVQFERIFDVVRTGPGDPYPPQLWRWEIDESSSKASQTLIDGRIQEFPRVDGRRWSRPYRYGYTVELMSASGAPSIVAHDTCGGETQSWSTAPGRSLSEAIFVPDSATAAENEGWLLSIDSDTEHSDLIVLDATAVAAGPVGRVRLPQRIPDGFHGDWIPSASA